jgi:GAF domain-containing protein
MPNTNETLNPLRQRRLAAQHLLSRVLASNATIDEAGKHILQLVGLSLGAIAGEIWVARETDTALELRTFWCAPEFTIEPSDLRAWSHTTFRSDEGLPGAVLTAGIPLWLTDVADEELFARREMAARVGLRAAVAFPIYFAGSTQGVVQFFYPAPRVPDDEVLELFADIGAQIGSFLERVRLSAALDIREQQLSKLQRALEARSAVPAANEVHA